MYVGICHGLRGSELLKRSGLKAEQNRNSREHPSNWLWAEVLCRTGRRFASRRPRFIPSSRGRVHPPVAAPPARKGRGKKWHGKKEEAISERSLRCLPLRWSQQELGLRKALSSLGAAHAGAGASPLENSGLRRIFSSKSRRLKGLGLCHDKPGYFAALKPLRYRVGPPLPFQCPPLPESTETKDAYLPSIANLRGDAYDILAATVRPGEGFEVGATPDLERKLASQVRPRTSCTGLRSVKAGAETPQGLLSLLQSKNISNSP